MKPSKPARSIPLAATPALDGSDFLYRVRLARRFRHGAWDIFIKKAGHFAAYALFLCAGTAGNT